MPDWSPQAPDRVVYESTQSGVWQMHCWDVATGAKRQVTDHPVGVITGMATFDGSGVICLAGRDRQRGRPVARGSVRRRSGSSLPRRHPTGLEPGCGAGGRGRRRRGQRPGRVRGLRLDRRRSREGTRPQHRGDRHRWRRGRWVQPGGIIGGWIVAVPRACRARRPPPPGAAGGRPPDRDDRGGADRPRHGAARRRLVPDPG